MAKDVTLTFRQWFTFYYVTIYFTFFYQRLEILETDKTLENDFTDKDILPLADKDWLLLYNCQLQEIGALNPVGVCMWSGSQKCMFCAMQTHAFQLFLSKHTWALPRCQMNSRTVATRRMHDG